MSRRRARRETHSYRPVHHDPLPLGRMVVRAELLCRRCGAHLITVGRYTADAVRAGAEAGLWAERACPASWVGPGGSRTLLLACGRCEAAPEVTEARISTALDQAESGSADGTGTTTLTC